MFSDCCISYNPVPESERLVIAAEKIRISTNLVALSPMISVSIEARDGAVYLHPNALKSFSKSLSDLFVSKRQLAAPFLHRLPGNLLADHLDSIGFVRILDFDWIEAFISRNKKVTKNEVTISGGSVNVKVCHDSTKSLVCNMCNVPDHSQKRWHFILIAISSTSSPISSTPLSNSRPLKRWNCCYRNPATTLIPSIKYKFPNHHILQSAR